MFNGQVNLLVTGGCGFIGSNFIRHLIRLNACGNQPLGKIVNLDKLTYAGNPGNLADIAADPHYHFIHGDIHDGERIRRLLSEHDIQAIVHFAAETHVDRSIDSPEPFLHANALGTLRLLESARRHWRTLDTDGAREFRFLHVSTDEVYGSLGPADPPFSETTPHTPNSPYAASKASADHFVRAYFHTFHLPVLTSNCSNNYGPYQFPEKLIPLMILNGIAGKPLPIYGDGKNVRDWLFVEDHCEALVHVLTQGEPGEVYNIGGNCEKPNLEIIDTLCEILDRLSPLPDGRSHQTLKTFVTDRPGHDRRYAINFGKIERAMGWRPKETLATGLEKTVRWYMERSDWCREIAAKKYRGERLGIK